MAELTVASFNTHWGVDVKGRPFDVPAAARALEADVLVVQEAWHPFGVTSAVEEIAAATAASLHEVTFMSDANPARPRNLVVADDPAGTCGLAVLSRLPVESAATIDLPRARGDVVDQRQALLLTLRVDDVVVAIAGVHASHRLWGSLPQLRHLSRELDRLALPSALIGDCNMWGPVIGCVLRDRRRAVRGRTWPAHRPHSQIDHIWVDDRFEVLDAAVGPAVGSDHRPVRARLRVR
jgi:endonuclease/exonuclease/phosphatase family metal-dependent hydrolase